jgi:hypothetical protein
MREIFFSDGFGKSPLPPSFSKRGIDHCGPIEIVEINLAWEK